MTPACGLLEDTTPTHEDFHCLWRNSGLILTRLNLILTENQVYWHWVQDVYYVSLTKVSHFRFICVKLGQLNLADSHHVSEGNLPRHVGSVEQGEVNFGVNPFPPCHLGRPASWLGSCSHEVEEPLAGVYSERWGWWFGHFRWKLHITRDQ